MVAIVAIVMVMYFRALIWLSLFRFLVSLCEDGCCGPWVYWLCVVHNEYRCLSYAGFIG